jgi:hypothetical protein
MSDNVVRTDWRSATEISNDWCQLLLRGGRYVGNNHGINLDG